MGLADLAETVEVLCHQMFYRVVGMQEAEMGVTGVGGCVRVRGGQNRQSQQSGGTDALLWASLIMKVEFWDLCGKSEATLPHKSLTFIYTGMS